MNTDLISNEEYSTASYLKMIQKIDDSMPVILEGQQNFFKTQSQFMDRMLTISHPTPLRNLRQILAEIQKSKMALEHAYLKNKKRRIRIKQKQQKIEQISDPIEKELIEVEISENRINISDTEKYMAGALRKIAAYVEQYESILARTGKNSFSEEDFEMEECRYHVGKAFEQALTAARSRGGVIDEGNHIYLQQIGVNGAIAQAEITAYLHQENEMIKAGVAPTHKMTTEWIEAIMDRYSTAPAGYAHRRGIKLIDKEALHHG